MKLSHVFITVVLSAVLALPVGAQEFRHEATPQFKNCGDGSYERVLEKGFTVGMGSHPPYLFLDPDTKKPTGFDWEIHVAVLEWLGIDKNKIKYEIMPISSQVPALLSKRTDIIGINFHITPDRKKVISFSGPAYWYGPAIITKKGNPPGIKSFDDLKGRKVGAIVGAPADEYLRHIGAEVVPFQSDIEQFSSIEQGRVAVILEDDLKFFEYLKNTPDSELEIVPGIKIPDEFIYEYGYGYARFGFRKEDCSLRAAYSQALAEIRANGHLSSILKKWGLSDRNLFHFPICK